jgi:pimeloyl-ACP methyl ester carboxylesterase
VARRIAGARGDKATPITSHRLADRLQVRHLPGMEADVLAGRYEVFEDRRAANGRKIPLDIVVLPARTATPAPEPLVFLAGGDLPPPTHWAAFLEHAVDRLRAERDILLVDSRGMGASHRLDCSSPDPATELGAADDYATWRAAVERCRENLSRRADLRLYTTPLAMDDLYEVCEWLGWSRVDLWGVSDGTKAARVYARQHPGRVRSMVLFGVLPLAPSTWTDRALAAQRGLDRVLADCERDSSCDANFRISTSRWIRCWRARRECRCRCTLPIPSPAMGS